MFGIHSSARRGRFVRRALTTSLALASAAALAACSSGSGGGSGDSGSGGDHEITFWHYYAQGIPATKKYTQDLVKMVAEENPGYTLKPVYVPSKNLNQKIVAAAGSKSGPDIFVEDGSALPEFVKAGALADFTKQFNAFKDKDQFPDSVITKVDGKIYGIKGFMNGRALWYNKDILDEFGIKPPKTMDELTAALKKIGKKHVGIALAGQGNEDIGAFPFITAYGWDYHKPAVKPLQQAFGVISDWQKHGYIAPDSATWTQDVVFQHFLAGNMAFAFGGNWQYGNAKAKAKFDFGVIPLPEGTQKPKVYQLGDYAYISAFAKDKDAAFTALSTMFLSKKGELTVFEDAGSLPTRKDLADDPKLKKDPVISGFLTALDGSVPYLIPGFGTELTQIRAQVGQSWSAVLAGQKSADQAAADAMAGIKRVSK